MEEESILDSIKTMLGISSECQEFDHELIVAINSVFPTLYQIGVKEAQDFMITSHDDTWEQLYGFNSGILNMIKNYVYMKVRMQFDPPTTSFVLESLSNQVKELEWRIYIESEGGFDECDENKRRRRKRSCSLRCSGNEMGNSEGS